MPPMSLAFAVYFECPSCSAQIDVGESTEEMTAADARSLATKPGRARLEGVCPDCHLQVTVSTARLRSRVRN